MFDGLREDWGEQERPAKRGSDWLPLILGVLMFAIFCVAFVWTARAQTQPQGQPMLNQALQARLLSTGTSFVPTRGLYIGDPVACNAAVTFAADSAGVTLTNLQPGSSYPFSIVKLTALGTTCGSIFGLY